MAEIKDTAIHELIVKGCACGQISGVHEVLAFDTESIRLDTVCGRLQLRGHELHIDQLSLEKGIITFQGTVDSIQYTKGACKNKQEKNLWQRLLR